MERYPGAEAFIDVLNAFGVQNIFFNPGIDTVPVQVTVSRLRNEGRKSPALVLCLDESVAMAAAYGHYGISGQPQVVLVHRELGTLQVGGQMHNAFFGRVPVLLCAGSLAPTERLSWQGPYDSCCMTRNCVKWDHDMTAGEDIAEFAQKALSSAATEPCAPVYLATSWDAYNNTRQTASPFGPKAKSTTRPNTRLLERAADILIQAKNPLIMAGHSGRHPQAVASLVELAETLGARALNSTVRVSFPTSHPLCVGVDPIGGGTRNAARYLSEADAILLVDYDLPYAPRIVQPAPGAKIVNIDIDPAKEASPFWQRKADIFLAGDSSVIIPALTVALRTEMTPEISRRAKERTAEIESEHTRIVAEREKLARERSRQSPIAADWLCHCLAQVIDEDTIIVNQAITQSSAAFEQIYRSKPGTWLGCAGGSIGWAPGAALGVKIAAPNKTVVSLTGDGGFIWGCPEAVLWGAANYHAPFLIIIFDNQAYGAIKGLVQRSYGQEGLSDQLAFDTGVGIAPPPDYAMIAHACGAYGRIVKEPGEVVDALKEALGAVKSGQAAVLDVKLV